MYTANYVVMVTFSVSSRFTILGNSGVGISAENWHGEKREGDSKIGQRSEKHGYQS